MRIYHQSQISWPKTTRNTIFPVEIRMSVDEFLKLDEYFETGKHERVVRDVLLRIIRSNPELIRMNTEGKI